MNIMQEISDLIQKIVEDLFNEQVTPELTRTDEQFGDFASNVALRLGKQLNQKPSRYRSKNCRKISKAIISKVQKLQAQASLT
jgi:arginyl-tRNA synthetase